MQYGEQPAVYRHNCSNVDEDTKRESMGFPAQHVPIVIKDKLANNNNYKHCHRDASAKP